MKQFANSPGRWRLRRRCAVGLFLLTGLFPAGAALADSARVAVAANFANTMEALAGAFSAATGHQLLLSTGSSGRIYAQVTHGAPYDLFFSADQAKPAALEADGLAVAGSRITYAEGALALWSLRDTGARTGWDLLRSGDFNRLAIANPDLAPYGAASVEVLERLQLDRATRDRWVRGENIAHTYQFVSTGNADLGFVALSQVAVPGQRPKGTWWRVPASLHAPIRQDAVLLRRGQHNAAALAFLAFLRSETARELILHHGYSLPAPPDVRRPEGGET